MSFITFEKVDPQEPVIHLNRMGVGKATLTITQARAEDYRVEGRRTGTFWLLGCTPEEIEEAKKTKNYPGLVRADDFHPGIDRHPETTTHVVRIMGGLIIGGARIAPIVASLFNGGNFLTFRDGNVVTLRPGHVPGLEEAVNSDCAEGYTPVAWERHMTTVHLGRDTDPPSPYLDLGPMDPNTAGRVATFLTLIGAAYGIEESNSVYIITGETMAGFLKALLGSGFWSFGNIITIGLAERYQELENPLIKDTVVVARIAPGAINECLRRVLQAINCNSTEDLNFAERMLVSGVLSVENVWGRIDPALIQNIVSKKAA
jgi:hypothetical protein